MQNSGSLSELSLREILERMQKERATGTLKLTTDSRQATLYFLFGHLFHAVDENREGEDVVYDALGWNHGDFAFDSKAKLPAEESIKVPTAEILTRFVPAEGPVEVAAADGTPAEAPSLTGAVEEVAPEMAPSETAAEVVPLAEEEEPMPEVFAETPPPPAEPLPMEAAAVVAPEMAAAVLEGPPVRGPKRRKTDVRPGTRPPETMQLYPVPMGKAIHEGLTTGFIDFPKLLRTLRRDNLTGYVRLQSETFRGVMLFSSGAVVEAIYDSAGSVSTGKDAFEAVNGDIEEGNGTLDVIQLSPEMVTALYQLLTAPSIYEKLVARFIKADALLDFLRDAKASGAVIVRSGEQNGIVLLRDGELLGAYTSASRDISESAEKVLNPSLPANRLMERADERRR